MFRLVFLGTSCGTPTKDKNTSTILVRHGSESFLLECGEGTQQRLMQAKQSYMRLNRIFLSHLHGDHFLGLPGVLATMAIHSRKEPLDVFGPQGTKDMVKGMIEVARLNLEYKVNVMEVRQGKVLDCGDYSVSACALNHDTPCYGYLFKEKDVSGRFLKEKAALLGLPPGPEYSKLKEGQTVKYKGKTIRPEQVMDYDHVRKGKVLAFIADTLPSDDYLDFIEGADLLVHESSFLQVHKTRARETLHSTAEQAARIAEKARVKKLVLTHFSPRYKDLKEFEKEAQRFFPETVAAEELMEIEV